MMERLKLGEYVPRWITKKRKLQSHVAKQILEDLIALNLKYMEPRVERRRKDRRKGDRRTSSS